MSNNFKRLAAQQRTNQPRPAIPQVDPAAAKPREPVKPKPTNQADERAPAVQTPVRAGSQHSPTTEPVPPDRPVYLTPVDTSEAPVNRGFHMYPSRHQQVTRDLTYIEDRKPWEIIEDALEEYVVKHYGKDHKRKTK